MSNTQEKKVNILFLCFLGLMAALCFVSNYLQIRIPIAGDTDTRIHFGNVFCLMAGFLFGGVSGGLAAGIGAAFFDILDPMYAPEFYITFLFKFLMAFVCGVISHLGKRGGKNFAFNLVGGVAGSMTYVVLYLAKTFIKKRFIEGVEMEVAWAAVAAKAVPSIVNGLIAVVVAVPLAIALHKALSAAHLDKGFSGSLFANK